jgi:hypothetical protein
MSRRDKMVNKLYAIFYKINIDSDWRYYGAFTTLDMTNDLVGHIKRRARDRAVDTKIRVFIAGEEQDITNEK